MKKAIFNQQRNYTYSTLCTLKAYCPKFFVFAIFCLVTLTSTAPFAANSELRFSTFNTDFTSMVHKVQQSFTQSFNQSYKQSYQEAFPLCLKNRMSSLLEKAESLAFIQELKQNSNPNFQTLPCSLSKMDQKAKTESEFENSKILSLGIRNQNYLNNILSDYEVLLQLIGS